MQHASGPISNSGRLRVMLICGSYPPTPCGVGDYTARLAGALAQLPGVDISVLTTRLAKAAGPGDPAVPAGPANVERIDAIEAWRLGALRPALAAVRRWRPDVVHVQYPAQDYLGPELVSVLTFAVRFGLGLPVVVTFHEAMSAHWRWQMLMQWAGKEFVVVRENFARVARKGFGWMIAGKPFHLIPNASNLPRVERTAEMVAEVRRKLGAGDKPLVAYFGFIQAPRGIEALFDIADPAKHFLAIVGGRIKPYEDHFDSLARRAGEPPWKGNVAMTGYVTELEAARILCAADAVVLPFLKGIGTWSTSLHAASLQGTFVLATSAEKSGYDPRANVCYVPPGDLGALRAALAEHLGRRQPGSEKMSPSWSGIAQLHLEIYQRLEGGARPSPVSEKPN